MSDLPTQGRDDLSSALAPLIAEIRTLRDHEEIRQAIYAYARGVDRGDMALVANAFHDDAYDDHGNFKGDKATAVAAIERSSKREDITSSMHHVGNILIDLKGDSADVETYFLAYQRQIIGGKTHTRTRAGRYLDHFARRDGRWRVLRRQVIDDWSRLDEVVSAAREVGPDNHHGTRNRHDPSHAVDWFKNG